MEQKVLLDKDGNPITKERIEEVFKEIYSDMKPLLELCEWEEDGEHYHCWRIGGANGRIAYTNDAGAAQINEAMKNMAQVEPDENWAEKMYIEPFLNKKDDGTERE